MIDFRYHLVSIIAVFLALAVGLVVGSTALSGPEESLLQSAQHKLSQTNDALTKDKQALTQQVTADQAFALANAERLVGGLLPGERVVLVLAPGASGAVVSGVTTVVRQAGATVTGQVQLNQSFLDIDSGQNESGLMQLAQRLAGSAGLSLPAQYPVSAVASQQAAAEVLAASILTGDGAALPGSVSQSIMTGLSQGNYLSVTAANGASSLPAANLAVLITPSAAPTASTAGAGQVLVAVAQELRAYSSGTVMAGPVSAIGAGSAIDQENSAGQVSTVDDADTESGQIMVAQELKLLLDGKGATAVGIGPGTAPSPAPTPAPTASSAVTSGSHR